MSATYSLEPWAGAAFSTEASVFSTGETFFSTAESHFSALRPLMGLKESLKWLELRIGTAFSTAAEVFQHCEFPVLKAHFSYVSEQAD